MAKTGQLHSAAQAEVLLLLEGRAWEYDRLTDLARQIQEENDRVTLGTVGATSDAALLARACTPSLIELLEALESFKTVHSVYRNSLNLTVWSAESVVMGKPQEASRLIRVVIDSLRAHQEWREDLFTEAQSITSDLLKQFKDDEQSLKKIERLEAYLGSLKRTGSRIQETLAVINDPSLPLKIEYATESLRMEYDEHSKNLAVRQRVQLVLMVGAAVYAALILFRLRRISRSMAKLNESLETRVEERTQELTSERLLLSSLIADLPSNVYWKDPSGIYLGCNDAFADLLQLESPDSIVGLSDNELPWSEASLTQKLEAEKQALFSSKNSDSGKSTIELADGVQHEVIAAMTQLRDHDGGVRGIVGVYTDVTELNRLRDRLQQSEKLESIGQLAAGIAHEINTPMQCVASNVEFLGDCQRRLFPFVQELHSTLLSAADTLPERADELREMAEKARLGFILEQAPAAVNETEDAAKRVIEIVRAMKVMSHPGTQAKAELDLNELIRNAAAISRNRWKYAAELDLELDDSMPMVMGLSAELSQVVLNLIVNAADAIVEKHGENGPKGRIVVRTLKEEDTVTLEVEDTGGGIPEEIRRQLFDPFFTTKEVGKGTGQGLAITYDIVTNKHGGTVDVFTTVGEGSCFVVVLPLQHAQTDRPGEESTAAGPQTVSS